MWTALTRSWRTSMVSVTLAALCVPACRSSAGEPYRSVAGGDAGRGAQAFDRYGCGACHMIPGIGGADGMVGPPLIAFGRRTFIAGEVPNTQQNLIRWLEQPQAIEPGTAMPNLGVTERDARDMAAYLYTLR